MGRTSHKGKICSLSVFLWGRSTNIRTESSHDHVVQWKTEWICLKPKRWKAFGQTEWWRCRSTRDEVPFFLFDRPVQQQEGLPDQELPRIAREGRQLHYSTGIFWATRLHSWDQNQQWRSCYILACRYGQPVQAATWTTQGRNTRGQLNQTKGQALGRNARAISSQEGKRYLPGFPQRLRLSPITIFWPLWSHYLCQSSQDLADTCLPTSPHLMEHTMGDVLKKPFHQLFFSSL